MFLRTESICPEIDIVKIFQLINISTRTMNYNDRPNQTSRLWLDKSPKYSQLYKLEKPSKKFLATFEVENKKKLTNNTKWPVYDVKNPNQFIKFLVNEELFNFGNFTFSGYFPILILLLYGSIVSKMALFRNFSK